jgi:hypothetical protein
MIFPRDVAINTQIYRNVLLRKENPARNLEIRFDNPQMPSVYGGS